MCSCNPAAHDSGNGTDRTLPPLPERIRICDRSKSMSFTLNRQHSTNRIPVPYSRRAMGAYGVRALPPRARVELRCETGPPAHAPGVSPCRQRSPAVQCSALACREKNRREGLILSRCRNMRLHRERGQELLDFCLSQFRRVSSDAIVSVFVVPQKPLNPGDVRLFRLPRIVPDA